MSGALAASGVLAALAVLGALAVLEALEESVAPAESVVPVESAIARRNCLRAAVVTIGSTTLSTVEARPIQTGQQQTGSGALPGAIPWQIARRVRGGTNRNSAAVSKQG